MPIVGSFAGASARAYGLGAGVLIGDFESIATTTLASDTQYVDFTSIPQTYTHLQIRLLARDNRATSGMGGEIRIFFNSDTASNYSAHILYGTGSVPASGNYPNNSYIYAFDTPSNTSTANVFTAGLVDIFNYTNTNVYKTTRGMGGADTNGGGIVTFSSGNWRNTAAITSIRISNTSGTYNHKQYSSFALYGVKA
jgi:hypothetical protein